MNKRLRRNHARFLSRVRVGEELVGHAEQLGFTDVIAHWPRAEGIYAGDESMMYEIASRFPAVR